MSAYSDYKASLAPVSWWRLDETSGTDAADTQSVQAGTHASGVAVNQATPISGDSGKSCAYDGTSNGKTDIPHNAAYNLSAGSVEVWFKTAALGFIIDKGSGATSRPFQIATLASTFLTSNITVGGVATTCTSLAPAGSWTDNNWRHVVLTFDGSTIMSLYGDGVLQNSKPLGAPDNNSNLIRLGGNASTTGNRLTGSVDEPALWNRVLTPQEVLNLYQYGKYGLIQPVAGISATPLSGSTPLAVQFTGGNTGGAAASWAWTFGDGATSTSQSPSHTYTTVGTYTVTLTVTNAAGVSVATQVAYITASRAPLLFDSYAVRLPMTEFPDCFPMYAG